MTLLLLRLLRRGAFTCVVWQVTLCDAIRQQAYRSSSSTELLKQLH